MQQHQSATCTDSDDRPLAGKTVLLAQGQEKEGFLKRQLEMLGAFCMEAPAAETVQTGTFAALDQAIRDIHTYQWLLFAGAEGVDSFYKRFRHAGFDKWDFPLRVAAVGTDTEERLKTYGVHTELVVLHYQVDGVMEALFGYIEQGSRVLLPQAEELLDLLPEKLRKMGARITAIPALKKIYNGMSPAAVAARLLAGEVNVLIFAGASTVLPLLAMLGDQAVKLAARAKVVCIGPITAAICLDNGIKPNAVAEDFTRQGLIRAVVSLA